MNEQVECTDHIPHMITHFVLVRMAMESISSHTSTNVRTTNTFTCNLIISRSKNHDGSKYQEQTINNTYVRSDRNLLPVGKMDGDYTIGQTLHQSTALGRTCYEQSEMRHSSHIHPISPSDACGQRRRQERNKSHNQTISVNKAKNRKLPSANI